MILFKYYYSYFTKKYLFFNKPKQYIYIYIKNNVLKQIFLFLKIILKYNLLKKILFYSLI